MRRYAQLTADEQGRATTMALQSLGLPDEVLNDATLRPRIDQLAQSRARAAFYLDPGDNIVTLPPPPTPTTP